MRTLTLLVLSLTLAGCSAFQPVPTPTLTPEPTSTPRVIVVTSLVTVIPTQPPTNTPVNTASPTVAPILLTLQAVSPTPSFSPNATLTVTPDSGEVNVPASMLGEVFSKIAFSTNRFSLRCEPKTIHFEARVSDMHIVLVEFYYRVRAKNSTYIPPWTRGGTLETDDSGRFWLDYYANDVPPDNRKPDGWFELEFVGVNNLNQVVGRTSAIVELIAYTIDCPE
jgi:hypothetical protein